MSDGTAEGGKGIFRHAVGGVMQPAMGVAPTLEALPADGSASAAQQQKPHRGKKKRENDNKM